jgi:tetratricopeptide (TPR) repeat protein
MTEATNADQYFDLGDEYSTNGARALQSGDTDEGHEWFRKAIVAYEAALGDAPGEDVVLQANLKLCIGARLMGLGDLEGAGDRFADALSSLEARPDLASEGDGAEILAQAKLNRADLLLATGAHADALAQIEEVLARFPDHPYGTYLRDRCRSSE